MTMSQLSTLVVSWLDDANQGYFTPAQVNVWLNMAHRQAQMELLQAGQNWYMKPSETLTVLGQADYVLPSDFIFEHRLELVKSGTGVNEDRRGLTPMTTVQAQNALITTGMPDAYLLKKDRFTLFQTPDAVYTIRLYYSPIVADLSADTDVPDVPEQFMEYVALLAAFNGFIKDDRAPNSLQAKKEEFKTLLKQMAVDRTQDRSRQVVQVYDYDNGGLAF